MARSNKTGHALPIARTTENDYTATGNECFCSVRVELAPLIERGHGDVPLISLRLRCLACGSRDIARVASGSRLGAYY